MKFITQALSFAFLFGFLGMNAQEEIKLNNPSFEGTPTPGQKLVPFSLSGWHDCGFSGQTPPDIQPNAGFNVTRAAFDGNTYVGLVTREDDTYESMSQKLEKNIQAGKCYEFSIALCRSDVYYSISVASQQEEQFTNAVKLRIWGGNSFCEKAELLSESPLIMSTQWKEYTLGMKPRGTFRYLLFEAYYKTPTLFPYNGNLLLDKLSSIKMINCPGADVADAGNKNNPSGDNGKTNPITDKNGDKGSPTTETTKTPDVFVKEIKAEDLKVDQTLRIDNLEFDTDSEVIKPESYKILEDVYTFLKKNTGIQIEIGGHTNGLCGGEYCRTLSEKRSKAVYQYLVKKGISANRLKFKGYGKSQPIATNETKEGQRKNQRVEIKILKND